MNKLRAIVLSGRSRLILLLIFFGSVIGLYIYHTISPGVSALVVESNTEADVYVNGINKGRTPLEIEEKEGDVVLKLVTTGSSPREYTQKIRLGKDVKTIVRRKFGESVAEDSTLIATLEKYYSKEPQVVIVTDPENAEVSINENKIGNSPLTQAVAPGEYDIKVSKSSFGEEKLNIKAVSGYKLLVYIDLGRVIEPKVTLPEKVVVKETPTGYLRVRQLPQISSKEVLTVKPGDVYEILEFNDQLEWYKIALPGNDPEAGWVLGEYVHKVSEGE